MSRVAATAPEQRTMDVSSRARHTYSSCTKVSSIQSRSSTLSAQITKAGKFGYTGCVPGCCLDSSVLEASQLKFEQGPRGK